MLLVARVLSAFAHGVFFSVGSTIAADLVPENRRASAIAMMFMGLTVAIVTGVPLGTFIGQTLGWRATFWAVSALGVVAFAAIAVLLPSTLSRAAPTRLIDQVRVLGSGRLLLVFAMTALGYGGTFVTFTFLASDPRAGHRLCILQREPDPGALRRSPSRPETWSADASPIATRPRR